MTPATVRSSVRGPVIAVSAVLATLLPGLAAAKAPEIRTSPSNQVPACVTPERLMAFLKARNGRLNPRFNDIAKHYKTFGEAWRVRWDYAFYQMAIETNFLTYRAPNGRMGDVDPDQNNFAGIGTTGGGVPGDSFADVQSGVHAQIQHLVVYSGERLAAPIAPRTQLKQGEILEKSLELNRPVRFGDLARRWAVDPNYDKSIEWVADLYRKRYCTGREATETVASALQVQPMPVAPTKQLAPSPDSAARVGHPAVRTVWVRSAPGEAAPQRAAPAPLAAPAKAPPTTANDARPDAATAPGRIQTAAMLPTATATQTPVAIADPVAAPEAPAAAAETKPAFDPGKTPPSHLGGGRLGCSIGTASYGGNKTVLIKSGDPERLRYTALTVIAGFEKSLTDSYIKARAPGGTNIGEFDTAAAALEKASALCPSAD